MAVWLACFQQQPSQQSLEFPPCPLQPSPRNHFKSAFIISSFYQQLSCCSKSELEVSSGSLDLEDVDRGSVSGVVDSFWINPQWGELLTANWRVDSVQLLFTSVESMHMLRAH